MRSPGVSILFINSLLAVLANAQPIHPKLAYGAEAIPAFGGSFSFANAGNDQGHVVGFAAISGDLDVHAFLWRDGAIQDLGVLPGDTSSMANGINDHDQIVGVSFAAGSSAVHAFIWENGSMRPIATLGGDSSDARKINNRGQVVGFSSLPGNLAFHAFRWEDGVFSDLGTLGGSVSAAFNINQEGQIVGASETELGTDPDFGITIIHAFLWEKGVMLDLGTLGGHLSAAEGINDRGQVTGAAETILLDPIFGVPLLHPFLWDNGVMRDLGMSLTGENREGDADAINNASSIVGASGSDVGEPIWGFQIHDGFIWQAGTLVQLSSLVPGVSSIFPQDINARGQIVANGVINDGFHGLLLTPGGPSQISDLPPAFDTSTTVLAKLKSRYPGLFKKTMPGVRWSALTGRPQSH